MAERILIVDDDPVQRRLIENMVSRFGYEAVVVDALLGTDMLPGTRHAMQDR